MDPLLVEKHCKLNFQFMKYILAKAPRQEWLCDDLSSDDIWEHLQMLKGLAELLNLQNEHVFIQTKKMKEKKHIFHLHSVLYVTVHSVLTLIFGWMCAHMTLQSCSASATSWGMIETVYSYSTDLNWAWAQL